MVPSPRISIGPAGCRINRDYVRRGWAAKTSHPNWGPPAALRLVHARLQSQQLCIDMYKHTSVQPYLLFTHVCRDRHLFEAADLQTLDSQSLAAPPSRSPLLVTKLGGQARRGPGG